MKLCINGHIEQFEDRVLSVTDLLHRYNAQERKAAVAVNGCFVPKSQYDTTQLQANDEIEIVSPMQGG